jgi:hypothetical protein
MASEHPYAMTVRTEAAEANLDRLLEWISRVDNKAAFSLLTGTAMLGTLVSFAPKPEDMSFWLRCGAYATGVLLLLNAACIMLVAFPRTRDRHIMSSKPSLFYFGTLAKLPLKDYLTEFKTTSDDDILEDLLGQCHVNARILDAKFWYLRWSYAFLYLAAPLWTTTMLRFLTIGGSV